LEGFDILTYINEFFAPTIILAIIGLFVSEQNNLKKIEASLHNTINWRKECFELTQLSKLHKDDIYKLQALVSPLSSEAAEEGYVSEYCQKLLDKPSLTNSDTDDFRKLTQLLLKLNWLKHGDPSQIMFFHFIKKHQTTIKKVQVLDEMNSITKGPESGNNDDNNSSEKKVRRLQIICLITAIVGVIAVMFAASNVSTTIYQYVDGMNLLSLCVLLIWTFCGAFFSLLNTLQNWQSQPLNFKVFDKIFYTLTAKIFAVGLTFSAVIVKILWHTFPGNDVIMALILCSAIVLPIVPLPFLYCFRKTKIVTHFFEWNKLFPTKKEKKL